MIVEGLFYNNVKAEIFTIICVSSTGFVLIRINNDKKEKKERTSIMTLSKAK